MVVFSFSLVLHVSTENSMKLMWRTGLVRCLIVIERSVFAASFGFNKPCLEDSFFSRRDN